MTPKVQEVIKEFEDLQFELAGFGAMDSTSTERLHEIVMAGFRRRPVDWPNLNWNLYTSERGYKGASRQLNLKAKKVYNTLARYAVVEDEREIEEYAWRE